ncbi:MAG: amino acid ABC transporter permease [Lachnospiraceae bacterium]|nr:amino acid ABC transporter permease [Lachnospiraceae bacterium]
MDGKIVSLLIDSFWKILLPGLKITIPLTVITFAIGMVLALFCAMVQITNVKVLSQISKFYIWIFRGTPLLIQLFIIFYGLPKLGILLDAFPAAVITFSLNIGAYNAEVMRAAILAVPVGQMEAGYSVGMNYFQIMARIVLPQAFRIAFPSLSNNLISLNKDTSLAASITLGEMFLAAQRIAARTFEPLALYCEVAFIYLIMSTVLAKLQTWGEKKLSVHERRDNETGRPL